MKSRVQKNRDLHQKLSNSIESDVESRELSQFANRLNQIDDQFKKMNLPEGEEHKPQRARHNNIEEELLVKDKPVQQPVTFDTFESTYLKDFLDEVKEYNVKKGYRDDEDTQSNIMSKITGRPTIRKAADDPIQAVLNEIDSDLAVSEDQEMESIRIFSVDTLMEDETVTPSENADLDQTIALAVQEMVMDEEETASPSEPAYEEEMVEDVPMTLESYLDEVPEDFSDIEDIDEELIVDEELDLDLDDDFDIDSLDVDALTNDAFHRELIEQTQTLQHRIVDQEKHIEDMSDTIVRTNRMLNAVLAILLLAIFVVIVLIAVQFSKII